MKKNKKTALIIVIFLLVSTVLGVIYYIFDKPEQTEFSSSFVYNSDYKPKSYNFYTPEYDIDIMEDEDYLKQVPYIYYARNGETVCITDGNYAEYGKVVELFGEYFDALKQGDTDRFNSLHSERYFKFNRECTNIAPQRLYNIKIEYLREKEMSDPLYGDVTKYVFMTEYMIMKNDGTFRSDIGSDASRPLYLEIVYQNGKLFIDACGDSYDY